MSTGKEPLGFVDPQGKTEDEIADELIAQLRAAGIEVTDEPDGEPTD